MFQRKLNHTFLLRLAVALLHILGNAVRFSPPHFASIQRNLVLQLPGHINAAEMVAVGGDKFLGPGDFR